jgi:hypothetical protein
LLGGAADATDRPGFEFQALERDRLAAIRAQAKAGVVHARQRLADGAQLFDVSIGTGEVDLAVGIALRRIVAVLLQDLAGRLAAAAPGLVLRHTAIEFMLAHLQQLLQQRTLARAQKVGHFEFLAVMSAASSPLRLGLDLMVINACAPPRDRRPCLEWPATGCHDPAPFFL